MYSSHYENMHSIFLHFLVGVFFNLGKLFVYYLTFISFVAIIINVLILILTAMICKKILIATSRLLLHALPIEDEKFVNKFLR